MFAIRFYPSSNTDRPIDVSDSRGKTIRYHNEAAAECCVEHYRNACNPAWRGTFEVVKLT